MMTFKDILISIVLGSAAITGCKSRHTAEVEPDKYTATSPLRADTAMVKDYVAQIQSVRNIEIRSQEKGFLQNIYVDEGQTVKAGQVLFRIMPKIYEAEMQKARAMVKEAEVDVTNTRALVSKDVVAKTELAIKLAKLDEAKADLALAELHLSFTEIRAPYDGVIDRIRLKLGSLIDEGALLTTLSDNKSVFAYFNLPETEYLNYKAHTADNTSAVSLLLANGEIHKYPGVIETVEGEFDNETGNIAFRAKFPNNDMILKHGETGKVKMRIALNNALLIPQKATYELQDKIYVYVIDKNNVVKARNITIKGRLPELFVVSEGLAVDEKILLDGLQKVKEDDKITYTYTDPKTVMASLQLINQKP